MGGDEAAVVAYEAHGTRGMGRIASNCQVASRWRIEPCLEGGAQKVILKPDEAERFYRVWWPLLHFTNRETGLFPRVASASPTRPPPTPEAALRIRNALWSDPTLLTRFVKENPQKLQAGDLALAESWRHRVQGTFFVFRYLTRHSVLIDDQDPARAFAVKGLQSSFRDLLGPDLPVAVQAVLLPFEDVIVYDGLLEPYPVAFGNGIRRSLNEAYSHVRERDGVISSLPPAERAAKTDPSAVRRRNVKLLDEFRRHSYLLGRSSATVERDVSTLQTLAETRLMTASPPRGLIDVAPADLRDGSTSQATDGAPRSESARQAIKRFIRFLDETGRLEPARARALHSALERSSAPRTRGGRRSRAG